jgi:hypothetical protein
MPVEIKLLEEQLKDAYEQLKDCDDRHRAGILRHIEILRKDLEYENFKYGGFTD